MKGTYLLSCSNVNRCINSSRCSKMRESQVIKYGTHSRCNLFDFIFVAYPCPIFSKWLYFFLGSPTLTIVPVSNRKRTKRKISVQDSLTKRTLVKGVFSWQSLSCSIYSNTKFEKTAWCLFTQSATYSLHSMQHADWEREFRRQRDNRAMENDQISRRINKTNKQGRERREQRTKKDG